MSKIALITDIHIGCRGDSNIFHDYYERFYTNVFIPHLISNKITTVICLGDTFDKRKQINFVSLDRATKYLFGPLEKHGIHMYCLVGNHDAPYKNHIKESSPKFLLSKFNNIDVIDYPQELVINGKEFAFLPWVCADNQSDSISLVKNTTAPILISHLELAGFEMHKGQLSEHGHFEKSDLSGFERVWSGHYHHRSSQGNITYLGNPYALTWNDYDDPRGFHVYDCEHDMLEFIQNPYQMFYKYFYDDENKDTGWIDSIDYNQYAGSHVKVIVTKKTDFLTFDTFIHKLQEVNPAELKVIEDFSEFDDSVLDDAQLEAEDTLTLLNIYIDGITTDVNKEELKRVMRELYMEANIDE